MKEMSGCGDGPWRTLDRCYEEDHGETSLRETHYLWDFVGMNPETTL